MCAICKLTGQNMHGSEEPSWDEDPINKALASWETKRDLMENIMTDMGLGDFLIDEIALLFPTRQACGEFVLRAVQGDGVKLFNRAVDQVETWPFRTQYDVEYLFLETRSTMRVECMSLADGFSPLHAAMLTHLNGNLGPVVVHMSFKTENAQQFNDVMDKIDDAGHTMVQECKSTYGQFAYWNIEGPDVSGIYLKPRVNLRDDRGEFGMPGLGSNVSELFNEGEGE